jgi:glycosyltransferase involved in cell wall biosynthesis
LLPLYLAYFSTLRPPASRLVVSSCVAFTNAVRVQDSALHVSYVYTPPRFVWDLEGYLRGSSFSGLTRLTSRAAQRPLRRLDRRAGRRPDVLIAISKAVQQRISRAWGRDSEVIYPPVETAAFPLSREDDGYLLIAARLLAYRRIDIAVEAARRLGRDLVVAGSGPEMTRLRRLAGPRTRFVGYVSRPDLIRLVQRCHAYLVPGVEDFGIAPVEAMSSGKPVVAVAAGGVLETVVDHRTGLLVRRPTVAAFTEAIEALDQVAWDPEAIRASVLPFDRQVFKGRWRALLDHLGLGDLLSSDVPLASGGLAWTAAPAIPAADAARGS